jgi:acylphosphatase
MLLPRLRFQGVAMALRAVRTIISGRVQGVGYRAFVTNEALRLHLSGWVRNRRDGTVEAVFSGDEAAVEEVLALCRKGPPSAVVGEVKVSAYAGPMLTRFTPLPTE